LHFALHVPYYGGCDKVGTTTGAPMLFFLAGHEDFTSPESCATAVKLLQERGAKVTAITYPQAYHGFDIERKKPWYVSNATSVKCSRVMDLDTLGYYFDGKKVTPQEYADTLKKCVTRGATIAFDHHAKYDSLEKTKAFVSKEFGL
jgi:dienelactone hydrolase